MANLGIKGARRLLAAACLIGNLVVAAPVRAQDATWLASPTVAGPDAGTFDFNANANWNPATAPTGTATFGASPNGANISFSAASTSIGGFTFNAAASNYAFTVDNNVNFVGAGILVNGGSATITNNNGGQTSFSASSTAGSATINNNNNGATNFSNSSTAGSATINNNNGFATFFDSSTAGSAIINNAAGSQTSFLNSSTAGSATINNNHSITLFFDSSTAGSAIINNAAGSQTEFLNSSTAGSATINNNNNSSTVFGASSTAGSATINNNNNNGFTVFTASSTAGSAIINNAAGGQTSFIDSSTAGSATINNNGNLQFFNTSTAGSAVITNNGGGTQFFNTSTAGSATITNNGGSVVFFGNSDGGSAHLINGAGGTIDFSFSAGPNNDNKLSVGSLQGSGTFIVGHAELVTVTGGLAFTSVALYLVQVQGAHAGQIAVAGTAALAGNVEVDVLSRLTQKTTYTILTSSGLNNTAFSAANLEFANNFARDPVLSVVGNNVLLTLDPGLLSPILPANAPANQVKVAGAIDNGLLAGNNLTNAFSAIFNLSGNGLLNGLTQISGETATGSQQTTFDAMGQFMGLLTDPFMNRGGGAGATGFAEEEDQANAYAVNDKSRSQSERDAYAMFTKAPLAKTYDPRWSVWAAGFGGSQNTDGNAAAGSNSATSRIAGTAVGADYLLSPRTLVGFALAGGGTNFSVANGGNGRSDLFQAGVYLRHTNGPAYVSAALAYGWQDVTTDRVVTVAGLDHLRAEFNANAWSGRLEGGYRFVAPMVGGLGITPYAAAQFVTFDLPAYAEQAIVGLNTFALAYGARNVTDPRTELGIRTDKSFALSDGVLTLRGRFAWAHDYDPDRSIAATFQSLPGASFVVNGAALTSDSALTTASIERKWLNGWSAAATFEGEFSNVTRSYAGKGVVRYQW